MIFTQTKIYLSYITVFTSHYAWKQASQGTGLHYTKLGGKDIANLKNRGQTQGQDQLQMTPEERQASPDRLQTSSDPTLPTPPTLILRNTLSSVLQFEINKQMLMLSAHRMTSPPLSHPMSRSLEVGSEVLSLLD